MTMIGGYHLIQTLGLVMKLNNRFSRGRNIMRNSKNLTGQSPWSRPLPILLCLLRDLTFLIILIERPYSRAIASWRDLFRTISMLRDVLSLLGMATIPQLTGPRVEHRPLAVMTIDHYEASITGVIYAAMIILRLLIGATSVTHRTCDNHDMMMPTHQLDLDWTVPALLVHRVAMIAFMTR